MAHRIAVSRVLPVFVRAVAGPALCQSFNIDIGPALSLSNRGFWCLMAASDVPNMGAQDMSASVDVITMLH